MSVTVNSSKQSRVASSVQRVRHHGDGVVALGGPGLQRLPVSVDALVRVGEEAVESAPAASARGRPRGTGPSAWSCHDPPSPRCRGPSAAWRHRPGAPNSQPSALPLRARLRGPSSLDQPVRGHARGVNLRRVALDGPGSDESVVAVGDQAVGDGIQGGRGRSRRGDLRWATQRGGWDGPAPPV